MNRIKMTQDEIFKTMTPEQKITLTAESSAFIKKLGALNKPYERRGTHRQTRPDSREA